MGNNDISSTISINSSYNEELLEVSRMYYSKLFLKNKKSLKKFKMQITSIIKRLSYLPYQWANTFKISLQSSNIDQIYAEYLQILKNNYMREGRKEKVFHASKLGHYFLTHVNNHYKLNSFVITTNQLQYLIKEYKCYAIVMNWLNKLSTSKTSEGQECSDEQVIHPNYVQDKHAYSILLKAIMKMNFEQSDNSKLQEENKQTWCKNPIAAELMKLKTRNSFLEKQHSIYKIQKMLMSQKQEGENIALIKRTLGKGEMYTYLLAVRELGNIDVQYLWGKLYGDSNLTLFY